MLRICLLSLALLGALTGCKPDVPQPTDKPDNAQVIANGGRPSGVDMAKDAANNK
jgi:hypothetical protein